jgi:hypothetical protein
MQPAFAALLFGATCIALSPIFVRIAEVGPTASAFWRVALAAPLLWPLAWMAPRGAGAPIRWQLRLAASFSIAGDLAFWHRSIQ